MERGLVEKAGDSEECDSSSAVASNMLTCMPSHSSGSEAASSVYYSARIEGLSELRSKIDNQLEFDVESSRFHWTEVSAASDDSDEQVSNRVVFESMKKDPQWGQFFRYQPIDELEIGAKIAEGGQAEIFEAYGRDKYNGKRSLVLKVFKKGYSLLDLQRLWPPGIIASVEIPSYPSVYTTQKLHWSRNHCWPLGVHLLDDGRFAFIFRRYTGDLRKLIDQRMMESNGCPPFSRRRVIHFFIKDIAQGMRNLHAIGILHNDLKAANVLVCHDYSHIHLESLVAVIADFESSIGTAGTGFWRAPEILLALKNRNMRQEIFTKQTDVYSFAMTCYEIIIGCMPFEDHNLHDYDIVLQGERPTLPNDPPYSLYNNLVTKCWHQDPCQRPSFEEIIIELSHLWRLSKD